MKQPWVKIMFALLICVVFLIVLLPTLMSTQHGTKILTTLVNNRIPGNIEVQKLHLSWLDHQLIDGIVVNDAKETQILSIDSLEIDQSLIQILFNKFKLEGLKANNLNATLVEVIDGVFNLQTALGLASISGPEKEHPIVISIEDANMTAQFSKDKHADLNVLASGKTTHENILGYFDLDVSMNPRTSTVHQLSADMKDFPLALAEQLLVGKYGKVGSLLRPAFGESINLKIDQIGMNDGSEYEIAIESSALKTYLQLFLGNEGEWFLRRPSKIHLDLSPSFFQFVSALYGFEIDADLLETSQADVTIDSFKLIPKNKHVDFNLSVNHLSTNFVAAFLGKNSAISLKNWVGSTIDLKLNLEKNGNAIDVQGSLLSQYLNVPVLHAMFENDVWTIRPTEMFVQMQPKLMLKDFSERVVEDTIPVKIKIDSLNSSKEFKEFGIHFEASSDPFTLHAIDPLGKIGVNAFQASINATFPKTVDCHLTFDALPEKQAFLGPQVNVICDLNLARNESEWHLLNFDTILQSENLHAEAHAIIEDNKWVVSKAPAQIDYQPSSEALTYLSDQFVQMSPLKITLKSFRIPLRLDQISHSAIFANLSSASVILRNQSGQNVELTNLSASLDSSDLQQKIEFHVKANELGPNETNPLFVEGNVEHLFAPDGSLNLDGLTLRLQANSQQLPTNLICQIACLDDKIRAKIYALLGRSIETNIKVTLDQLNGPIQATLKGENGYISLDAQVNKGILTLNKPFLAEVKVTPELSQTTLQDVLPLLKGSLSGNKPIKIFIDTQGFSIPLKHFQIQNLELSHAMIDLGKITFSNTGELAQIVSLLEEVQGPTFPVWFTPLYFRLEDGKLRLSRMDLLLLDRYPIALWGKIDLIKEKVDLLIGLSGAALEQALGVQGLQPTEMLQIPFKGPIGKASIDKRKAATRISALVAQSQGGPKGLLVGTILNIAGGTLSEDPPPKPTTDPLPWAEMIKQHQAQPKKADVKSDKKEANPKSKIKDAANSIIKKLFE